MKTAIKIATVALMVVAMGAVQAANPPASLTMVPAYINYQGRLVTPTNSPYTDANHVVDLTLYKSASSSLPADKLWSERYTVPTRDGFFSVNLGSGGTPLLASNNLPVWQVMWRTDGASPDTLYMAMTVRTDQNGVAIASPAEATPRQQFLTAPYAFRAHQSTYATKADGLFDAPAGVQTPTISSTNNEVAINANVRVPQASTVFANKIEAQGTTPTSRYYAKGGNMIIGGEVNFRVGVGFVLDDSANSISIGTAAQTLYPGTAVSLHGKSINLNSTNINVRNQPMFISKTVSRATDTTSTVTSFDHGIDTAQYDVFVTGFFASSTTPIKAAYCYPYNSTAYIQFTAIPSGGTAYLWFLGIRKGLTDAQ